MPRFLTVPPENVERCLSAWSVQANGAEPIIVDDVLVAVKLGNYRVAPAANGKSLVLTQEQPADA